MLAEGSLKKNDVAIYYVEFDSQEKSSNLVKLEIQENGSIPQWPEGMFEEVMKEILAINNQRIRDRK
jgi:predicted ATPase